MLSIFLSAIFATTAVGLSRVPSQAPTTKSLAMCQCNINTLTCLESPVSQGDELSLCYFGEHSMVDTQEVTLSQGRTTITLVSEGRPKDNRLTKKYPVGNNLIIIRTQLQSIFFREHNPEPLHARISSVGIDITIPVERKSATELFENVNSTYEVQACQCNAAYACHKETLKKGSSLFLCLFTNATNIYISDVMQVELVQGTEGQKLFAVRNSLADELTSVLFRPRGTMMTVIRTQLRSSFFEGENPEILRVRGKCTISFYDGSISDQKKATRMKRRNVKDDYFQIQMNLASGNEVISQNNVMEPSESTVPSLEPSYSPSYLQGGSPSLLIQAATDIDFQHKIGNLVFGVLITMGIMGVFVAVALKTRPIMIIF